MQHSLNIEKTKYIEDIENKLLVADIEWNLIVGIVNCVLTTLMVWINSRIIMCEQR